MLGFAFTLDNQLALILKKRPLWQKDRWNGIGGHIEPNETPIRAMIREFYEEANVAITEDRWREVAFMQKIGEWDCVVFTTHHDRVRFISSKGDERVLLFTPADFAAAVMDKVVLENVALLAQACVLKPDRNNQRPNIVMTYE